MYNVYVITYYILTVKQYFAIAIILVDQNHVIRLLQCMRYIELLLNPSVVT